MNTHTKRTYDQVFQHPMTHNLEWGDIRSLFEAIGDVEQEHNGNMKVTLGGEALVFQAQNASDVASADQVSQIRHFVRNSEKRKKAATGAPHLLVVMDHQEARIYRTEMTGAVPELVTPHNALGHESHVHSSHDYSDHIEQPNYGHYFEAVAKCLVDAEKIVIFGSGTGSSASMQMFVDWLGENHSEVADRILAAVTIDQAHLSEGELLAKAREIYGQ